MRRMVFEDRRDAGRRLAATLRPHVAAQPIVVALPRGGVPVAFEVARALGAPLDLLTVRKLGTPQNPELGVGALSEDGTAVVDTVAARALGMTQEDLDVAMRRELRELARRKERFRGGRAPRDVRGREVIVVDDGLATGFTDLVAVRTLRRRAAGRIVVAAPVGSREAIELLRQEADDVVCHTRPRDLLAVGNWYRDFSPVDDEQVLALLDEWRTAAPMPPAQAPGGADTREPIIDPGGARLRAELTVPPAARGLVIFAHGTGDGRGSPRNRSLARALNDAGFATLLVDLLSARERERRELVFDVPLLAGRLEAATRWARSDPATRDLPIGFFGASAGAAAALLAAAAMDDVVRAVVSRGGRPDLADDRLADVRAPTLLIVGGNDPEVLELNRRAARLLTCPHRIEIVEGAGHRFEEPGALETVARLAIDWLAFRLSAAAAPRPEVAVKPG